MNESLTVLEATRFKCEMEQKIADAVKEFEGLTELSVERVSLDHATTVDGKTWTTIVETRVTL
jgi:hypothetical protein